MTPYYQDQWVQIFLGDCREILPSLPKVDCVVTDPPYPGYDYSWPVTPITELPKCLAFYFWMPLLVFPLIPTAMHVWSKANVNIGDAERYELIYEVNGKSGCCVFRNSAINCEMNAIINGDKFFNHPTQKPIKLMKRLVKRTEGLILDPFMGSGTTLRAAKDLGRKAIGIEIEEKYCEIAAKRMSQDVLWSVMQPELA
jgi:site-specific DNA-methyltransferase (adenine-specific)